MQYVVRLNHLGNDFWLRSTIWVAEKDRGNVFASTELAQAALNRAKMFMKAKQYKAAKIEPL